jgi:hypothetical protein
VRAKRKAQAESVAQLLIDLQTQYPAVPIVSVGDYNAFEVNDGYVDVLGIIRGNQAPPEQVVDWSALGLNPNFVEALSPGDYSYSFDGNAQTLDHVLLSSAAASTLIGIHHSRIDADFPEAFRADPMRPERLSDHDPAVARFSFPADTSAPVFGPVSDVTVAATSFDGATVTFASPTATDNVDSTVSVSCAPASGAFFPIGPTTVTCSATDTATNTATVSFVVTVQPSDEAGAMVGAGVVNAGTRVVFALLARQAATGAERGRLQIAFARPRGAADRFVAQAVDAVLFFRSAVRFSGNGEWNGVPGYTFVAEASDGNRSASDTFAVTVSSPQGAIVAQVSAALSAGSVERVR